jgi:hypothetical protein
VDNHSFKFWSLSTNSYQKTLLLDYSRHSHTDRSNIALVASVPGSSMSSQEPFFGAEMKTLNGGSAHISDIEVFTESNIVDE